MGEDLEAGLPWVVITAAVAAAGERTISLGTDQGERPVLGSAI